MNAIFAIRNEIINVLKAKVRPSIKSMMSLFFITFPEMDKGSHVEFDNRVHINFQVIWTLDV
jgi:hypothetical protein